MKKKEWKSKRKDKTEESRGRTERGREEKAERKGGRERWRETEREKESLEQARVSWMGGGEEKREYER